MRLLFLSHSGEDKEYAQAIGAQLSDWGFESVFVYWDAAGGIAGGTDWTRELYQKLRMAGALIALYSPSYFASKWCFAELTAAQLLGKPVIPLRTGGEVPTDLQAIQAIDYAADRIDSFARLRRALNLIGLSGGDDFAPDRTRSPYPGLAYFEEQDAPVFFGRSTEVIAALQALQRFDTLGDGGFLVIAGASGSGKSSLLRAGLLPRLKKTQPGRWLLLATLQPRHGFSPLADLRATLGCACSSRDEVVARIQAIGHERGTPAANALLVIDQFEQLFVDHPPPDTQEFLTLLAALVQQPTPLVVVAVLRSDYLDRLQTHAAMRESAYELFSLGLLSASRFPEIVQGPADVYGLRFEPPTLVERIAREAGTDEALPLIAFAMRTLWDNAQADGIIRETAFEALFGAEHGGIPGAVARTADQIIAGATPSEQAAVRGAFVRLVRFDLNEKPVRRQAQSSDLPEAARPTLEKLVNARLLSSRGEGSERYLNVAHESLFRVWPRLAGWIREDHGFHVWYRNLLDALQLAKRDHGSTLKGKALLEAERWLRDRPQDIDPDARAFILDSVAARNRDARVKKMWIGLAAGGVLVALAAVIYTMYAELGRQKELLARSLVDRAQTMRRLALEGDDFSAARLNHSLLLAVEAAVRRPDVETNDALGQSLTMAQRSARAVPITGKSHLLFFSSGGEYLARATETGVEVLTAAGERAFVVPFKWNESGDYLAWTNEHPYLVITHSTQVQVWDATTRTQLWQFTPAPVTDAPCGEFGVVTLALEPTGAYVAFLDGKTVRVREVASGRETYSLTEPTHLCTLAMSSGAQHLAFFDGTNTTLVTRATGQRLTVPSSQRETNRSFTFSPDATQLLTIGVSDVDLWEWTDAGVRHERNIVHWAGEDSASPLFAVFSPKGDAIGVLGDDFYAATVSLKRKLESRIFVKAPYGLPLGFIRSSGSDGFDVLDVSSGERLAVALHASPEADDLFAYDAQSSRLAFAQDEKLWIVQTPGGRDVGSYRAPADAISRYDSDRFAGFSVDSKVIIVDADMPGEIARFTVSAPVRSITIDDHGTRAMVFDNAGTLSIWDVKTARKLSSVTGIPTIYEDDHGDDRNNVTAIEFSHDLALVRVTATNGGGVWDAATGQPSTASFAPAAHAEVPKTAPSGLSLAIDKNNPRMLLVLDAKAGVIARITHENDVRGQRFTSDGRAIRTVSGTGVFRTMLWRTADLIQRACEVVSRTELDEDEWRGSFGSEKRRPTCPAK